MNKIMKTSVALVAAGMIGGVVASATTVSAASYKSELKTKGKLTVGLEGTYAPFSYRSDSGKLTGFEVELVKAVAKKMKLKPVFVQTKFDSLVAGLDAKKYDVVFNNMSITPERKKAYAFAQEYLFTESVMITKKGSKIKDYSDLKGKKAAQTSSSDFGQAATKAGATIVSAPGFAEALDLVDSGKADVTLNSQDSWGVYKKAHPKTDLQSKVTQSFGETTAAPMLDKKDKKLATQITKAEKSLQKDGTMKKLSVKYFGSDLTTEKK